MPESRLAASDATDDGWARRGALGLLGLLLAIAGLAGYDLVADVREGTTPGHVAVEGAVVLAALTGVGGLAWQVRRLGLRTRALARTTAELAQRLSTSQDEAARWRTEAGDLIAGLSAAIDRQLEAWGLSPAEKEVALLLLKGLSFKEIGELRGVGEATVRQQARALYKKAGLGGRADLAAFFLEDLLGPRPDSDPPRA